MLSQKSKFSLCTVCNVHILSLYTRDRWKEIKVLNKIENDIEEIFHKSPLTFSYPLLFSTWPDSTALQKPAENVPSSRHCAKPQARSCPRAHACIFFSSPLLIWNEKKSFSYFKIQLKRSALRRGSRQPPIPNPAQHSSCHLDLSSLCVTSSSLSCKQLGVGGGPYSSLRPLQLSAWLIIVLNKNELD